jgi:hypothetical protein
MRGAIPADLQSVIDALQAIAGSPLGLALTAVRSGACSASS